MLAAQGLILGVGSGSGLLVLSGWSPLVHLEGSVDVLLLHGFVAAVVAATTVVGLAVVACRFALRGL